jgi:type I restriction enzyme R subunit
VPFVYATNGHLFVGFDSFSGLTAAPCPIDQFPRPAELRARYEQGKDVSGMMVLDGTGS